MGEKIFEDYEKLEELMAKIDKAIVQSRSRRDSIEGLNNDLYEETRPMMVEKLKKDIEDAKEQKEELDDITRAHLINVQKEVLSLRKENEEKLQETILNGIEEKRKIDDRLKRKMEEYANTGRTLEDFEKIKNYAATARENLEKELEKAKQRHLKLRSALAEMEENVEKYAIELDVLEELKKVRLEDKEPGKDEPGKDEPDKDEPGKDEPGKDEPGKDEPGKGEPGKDEPGKDEPGVAINDYNEALSRYNQMLEWYYEEWDKLGELHDGWKAGTVSREDYEKQFESVVPKREMLIKEHANILEMYNKLSGTVISKSTMSDEEYEKAMEQYNKDLEEYEKKLEKYNKYLAELKDYEEKLAEYEKNKIELEKTTRVVKDEKRLNELVDIVNSFNGSKKQIDIGSASLEEKSDAIIDKASYIYKEAREAINPKQKGYLEDSYIKNHSKFGIVIAGYKTGDKHPEEGTIYDVSDFEDGLIVDSINKEISDKGIENAGDFVFSRDLISQAAALGMFEVVNIQNIKDEYKDKDGDIKGISKKGFESLKERKFTHILVLKSVDRFLDEFMPNNEERGQIGEPPIKPDPVEKPEPPVQPTREIVNIKLNIEKPEPPPPGPVGIEMGEQQHQEKTNLPARSFWEIYDSTNTEHAGSVRTLIYKLSQARLFSAWRKGAESDTLSKVTDTAASIMMLPFCAGAKIVGNIIPPFGNIRTHKKMKKIEENINNLSPEEFRVLVSSPDRIKELFGEERVGGIKYKGDQSYLSPSFMKKAKVNELYLMAVGKRLVRDNYALKAAYDEKLKEIIPQIEKFEEIKKTRELTSEEYEKYTNLSAARAKITSDGEKLADEISLYFNGNEKKSYAYMNIKGGILGVFNPDNRKSNKECAKLAKEGREALERGDEATHAEMQEKIRTTMKSKTKVRRIGPSKGDLRDSGDFSYTDEIEMLPAKKDNRWQILAVLGAKFVAVKNFISQKIKINEINEQRKEFNDKINEMNNQNTNIPVSGTVDISISDINGTDEAKNSLIDILAESIWNSAERSNLDKNNWKFTNDFFNVDTTIHTEIASLKDAVDILRNNGQIDEALQMVVDFYKKYDLKFEPDSLAYANTQKYDYSALNLDGGVDAITVANLLINGKGQVDFSTVVSGATISEIMEFGLRPDYTGLLLSSMGLAREGINSHKLDENHFKAGLRVENNGLNNRVNNEGNNTISNNKETTKGKEMTL